MAAHLDVVLFYADLGRNYTPLIKRMTESAKDVMPEARRVLVTPTPKDIFTPMFDKVVDISRYVTTTDKTICYDKVSTIVSWQSATRTNTVYVDPDLEFINPIPEDFNFDVGLLWRKRKPDQPINTGMILAKPGCPEFWRKYGAIAANLPRQLRGWFLDQLAASVLLGVQHKAGDTTRVYDANVHLFDMNKTCSPREKAEGDSLWAYHDKGQRKWNSDHTNQESSGGTLSEDYASLMDTDPE